MTSQHRSNGVHRTKQGDLCKDEDIRPQRLRACEVIRTTKLSPKQKKDYVQMPNVNEFLRSAVGDMPDHFPEKELALQFLDEQGDIAQKEKLALALLEAVAYSCECHGTWEHLVKERLTAAEKGPVRNLVSASRNW